jgi:hypothetical protein
MKRVLRTAIIMSLIAGGAPLAAQAPASGWDRDAFWQGAPPGPGERIDFLQARIDRDIANHKLNRREAMRADNELRRIREMVRTMRARDGGTLNDTDRVYLQDRLDQLSSNIHWMRHNDW